MKRDWSITSGLAATGEGHRRQSAEDPSGVAVEAPPTAGFSATPAPARGRDVSSSGDVVLRVLHQPADLRRRLRSSSPPADRPQVLPVAQYPEITPPIVITANYRARARNARAHRCRAPPGALSGVENLMYFSSTAASNGALTINCTSRWVPTPTRR
jgi:hypothetical protein